MCHDDFLGHAPLSPPHPRAPPTETHGVTLINFAPVSPVFPSSFLLCHPGSAGRSRLIRDDTPTEIASFSPTRSSFSFSSRWNETCRRRLLARPAAACPGSPSVLSVSSLPLFFSFLFLPNTQQNTMAAEIKEWADAAAVRFPSLLSSTLSDRVTQPKIGTDQLKRESKCNRAAAAATATTPTLPPPFLPPLTADQSEQAWCLDRLTNAVIRATTPSRVLPSWPAAELRFQFPPPPPPR